MSNPKFINIDSPATYEWICVWCGKKTTDDFICNSPDGDGHLFKKGSPWRVEGGYLRREEFTSILLQGEPVK
jgi:hypothetical protein